MADLDLDAKREARGYKRKKVRLDGRDWELAPALPVFQIARIVGGLSLDSDDPAAMQKVMDALMPILERAWGQEFLDTITDFDEFGAVMAMYGMTFGEVGSASEGEAMSLGESPASPRTSTPGEAN